MYVACFHQANMCENEKRCLKKSVKSRKGFTWITNEISGETRGYSISLYGFRLFLVGFCFVNDSLVKRACANLSSVMVTVQGNWANSKKQFIGNIALNILSRSRNPGLERGRWNLLVKPARYDKYFIKKNYVKGKRVKIVSNVTHVSILTSARNPEHETRRSGICCR